VAYRASGQHEVEERVPVHGYGKKKMSQRKTTDGNITLTQVKGHERMEEGNVEVK
jgi:hypothetical protein